MRRVIKRYSNRKLYDTEGSRYVTLLQIADMVRAGEEVQIIDNSTKEDKTEVTLALIISEELKARPRGIPLATLKALIRNRGEKILHTLRDGPIGRLMPKDGEELELTEKHGEAGLEGAEALGAVEESVASGSSAEDHSINGASSVAELRAEVRSLNERLTKLEQHISQTQTSQE